MTTNPLTLKSAMVAEVANLNTRLEVAALTALDLLKVANRELPNDLECGLSVIAAAERYLFDVLAINKQLGEVCTTK
jgi:hypothetical protein